MACFCAGKGLARPQTIARGCRRRDRTRNLLFGPNLGNNWGVGTVSLTSHWPIRPTSEGDLASILAVSSDKISDLGGPKSQISSDIGNCPRHLLSGVLPAAAAGLAWRLDGHKDATEILAPSYSCCNFRSHPAPSTIGRFAMKMHSSRGRSLVDRLQAQSSGRSAICFRYIG